MDMIYISHPYTGDEDKNRSEAHEITATLAVKCTDVVFVNPLDAMVHLADTDVPYETVLEQCQQLLAKCDGVIMAGNWKDSNGCNIERDFAKEQHIVVWDSMEEFYADNTMPNDQCGHHHCCRDCLCRTCSERKVCWNCNDCTKPARQKYAIGFTGKGVWDCSRYRKEN